MAEDKAITALKETNTKETIELVFRTYDKYGRRENKVIDVTDLVRKEVGDDLQEDLKVFAGLRYKGTEDGPGETFPAYRESDGRELKNHVKDMTTTAIVNGRQLEAMERQIDGFFHDFSKELFDRFWF